MRIDFDPFNYLSRGEEVMLRDISEIQIKSLVRVLKNTWKDKPSREMRFILENYSSDIKEARIEIRKEIERFTKVIDDPSLMMAMPIMDLNVVKHILFNTEDKWKAERRNELYRLWARLFTLYELRETQNELVKLISQNPKQWKEK